MSAVRVEADPARRHGYALIRIPGAAAGLADPRFKIQRPDEQAAFLGMTGWQPAETALTPHNAWVEGDELVLEIGPEIVDQVEDGTVGFSLPSIRLSRTVVWPVLAPSRGAGREVVRGAAKPAEVPVTAAKPMQPPTPQREAPVWVEPLLQQAPPSEPMPPLVPPTPVAFPADQDETIRQKVTPNFSPTPAPSGLKRSGWLPVFAALGIAGLIAASVWFYLTSPYKPLAIPTPPPVAVNPSPVPATNTCDTEPVPALFQCEKDAAKLYQIAQTRMQAGNTSDAIQIYQVAAQDGDGQAALVLATMYDPATFQSVITQADVAEAARYYEMAINNGAGGAAQPRAQLYQLLQNRAAQGDIQAPLILNDFWR